MIKSLRNYFRISIITICILLFSIFVLFSSNIHTSLAIAENQKMSESLSKQIFNSMYQIMRKGWSREELNDFAYNIRSSFKESSYTVDVYRSAKVDELFGKIAQSKITSDVQYVFDNKEEFTLLKDHKTKTITPIIAKEECLKCHINSKEGDILGAVKIEYDFNSLITETRQKYFIFSLIILPIMIFSAFLLSNNLLRKINLSITNFREKIENINSVKDFKNLDTTNSKKSFVEFNQIMDGLNDLSNKLKNIAQKKVEVHISNLYQREEFRQKSVTAAYTNGIISGFGVDGYRLAILSLS